MLKMESTLFVPVNLSFSENLRCLKMPLLVGAISQKRWPSETCFVFAGQNVNSGKFKHLKYSENVKFTGTNYIDSILAVNVEGQKIFCHSARFKQDSSAIGWTTEFFSNFQLWWLVALLPFNLQRPTVTL